MKSFFNWRSINRTWTRFISKIFHKFPVAFPHLSLARFPIFRCYSIGMCADLRQSLSINGSVRGEHKSSFLSQLLILDVCTQRNTKRSRCFSPCRFILSVSCLSKSSSFVSASVPFFPFHKVQTDAFRLRLRNTCHSIRTSNRKSIQLADNLQTFRRIQTRID